MARYGAVSRIVAQGCGDIKHAEARIDAEGRPYILYNPDYFRRIRGLGFTNVQVTFGGQDWIRLTILAHEIGHHINFHLAYINDKARQVLELEADETAGFILYKLGATLDQAQLAMFEPIVSEGESITHPSRQKRLAAIERGYVRARDLAEESYWQGIKSGDTEPGYRSYLELYPNGKYAGEARKRIAELIKSSLPAAVAGIERNMVRVSGGTFMMGCTSEQGGDCDDDESPAHKVTLSGYEIGKYEVTQAEWRAVMGSDPKELEFKGCDACPVERVSWTDVQEFLRKLNEMTYGGYRLPREAEWEYAARGGGSSRGYKYAGGNDPGRVAWYKDNSGSKTHPVGQKQANELGLYDMSGNVYEWCSDWYGDYPAGAQTNPKGLAQGSGRVIRGGGWGSVTGYSRTSNRGNDAPMSRNNTLGFRLARSSPQ